MNEFDLEAASWDANPYRTERARAVAQGIRASVPLSPQLTALEYGCGTGLLSFELQPYLGHLTLADSSSGMLAEVNKKIEAGGIKNMSALKLDLISDPLPPLKVHLIYTLMTLHHIPDTDTILRRFYALLDTPGSLCVADLDAEDGSFHGPAFTGHKGFDRDALARQVQAAGFRQVAFQTIYHTPRKVGEAIKHFPVFLMTASKE